MKMDIKLKAIASFAINFFGEKKQILKAQEEFLELSLALIHHERDNNEQSFNNVIDEIADAIIMLEQLKNIYPIEKINERVEFKIDRLEKRIERMRDLNEF